MYIRNEDILTRNPVAKKVMGEPATHYPTESARRACWVLTECMAHKEAETRARVQVSSTAPHPSFVSAGHQQEPQRIKCVHGDLL